MKEIRYKLHDDNEIYKIVNALHTIFGFFIEEIDEYDYLHIDCKSFILHQFDDYATLIIKRNDGKYN